MKSRGAVSVCKRSGKRGFMSEREAESAMRRARSAHRRRSGRLESRVYECEWCGRFHSTSMSAADYIDSKGVSA